MRYYFSKKVSTPVTPRPGHFRPGQLFQLAAGLPTGHAYYRQYVTWEPTSIRLPDGSMAMYLGQRKHNAINYQVFLATTPSGDAAEIFIADIKPYGGLRAMSKVRTEAPKNLRAAGSMLRQWPKPAVVSRPYMAMLRRQA